ncbi:hypothetical protein HDU78_008509 [Chytriomyces hyalinus]|nr:hypothetical protein HDU78_008509 [Chytriomyces hyalinus]
MNKTTESFRIEALAAELISVLGVDSIPAERVSTILRGSGRDGGPSANASSAYSLISGIASDAQLGLDPQQRHELLAKYAQIKNEHVSAADSLVALIDVIRKDPILAGTTPTNDNSMLSRDTTMARDYSMYTRDTTLMGRDASFLQRESRSSDPLFTPKRTRSASVSQIARTPANQSTAFVSRISAISGTPSAMDLRTPVASRRRSNSQVRTIKKKSGSNTDLQLQNLKAPLECRMRSTPATANKMISSAEFKPIGSLPLKDQESYIMEDLLFVLLGIDGVYIKRKPQNQSFLTSEDEDYKPSTYVIDPSLDKSLSSLIQRILPAASNAIILQHFINKHSRFEYGKVAHALAGALRIFLSDHTTLVAQLEHQIHFAPNFGLQKLWYHILPSVHVLNLAKGLVDAVREAEAIPREAEDDFILASLSGRKGLEVGELRTVSRGGGVLLSVLADRVLTMSGDATAKHLYSHLLAKASVPYFQMLRTWIHRGQIHDPYDEFLIQERRGLTKSGLNRDYNDRYWEQRYTLRTGATVPCFLEKVKEKVLLAGKYLNVVGECGIDLGGSGDDENWEERMKAEGGFDEVEVGVAAFGDVVQVVEEGRFVQDIERAYRFANRTLLNLLVTGNNLIDRLKSLKHYFLLDASDFLTHFLDLADTELSKPVGKVSVDRLTSMLELVLSNPSSASSLDVYKEHITVEMSSYSLVEQLLKVTSLVGVDHRDVFVDTTAGSTIVDLSKVHLEDVGMEQNSGLRGIDSITLGYNASFPVSLIINKRVMTKYQLLFRHLLHCKNVERQLTNVWAQKSAFLRQKRQLIAKSIRAMKAAAKTPVFEKSVRKSSSLSSIHSGPERVQVVPAMTPAQLAALQSDVAQEAAFLARVSSIQSRMLTFVQQFLHFICFDVIEPNWNAFEACLKRVETVEEVQQVHHDFLDTCLKDCLMTNQVLLKHFGNLMRVCSDFAAFSNAFLSERIRSLDPENEVDDNDTDSVAQAPESGPNAHDFSDISSDASPAWVRLAQFESTHISSMRDFIHALQFADSMNLSTTGSGSASSTVGISSSVAVLQDLVSRIDYNYFYSRASAFSDFGKAAGLGKMDASERGGFSGSGIGGMAGVY